MWLLLLGACQPPGPLAARAAWIQDQLTDDNAYWLTRSPALVETKYARMSADPYDWMRGTTALFLADQVRSDPDRPPTAFLRVPQADAVLLVGDPHIENLGTCLAGEEPDPGISPADASLTLEWVDFDAAAYGPWTFDTRRAALALGLVAESLDCDVCLTDAIAAFARAYAAEIEVRAADAGGWSGEMDDADGALVTALRERAHTDGIGGAELDVRTVVEAGDDGIAHRRLLLDPGLDADGDGLVALRPWEEEQLHRLLQAWDEKPADYRLLDAARLYGKGVASLPALRFLVLWDRGGAGLEDDRLLNIREVGDPPSVDRLVPGIGSIYVDNADRSERVAETLWSRPDADVRMDGLLDGAVAFKVTTTSGWFQTFDHGSAARLVTLGAATDADVDAFATLVGRALASAHARGRTLRGEPAIDVIAADLRAGGGADRLVDERERDVVSDLAVLHQDYTIFGSLIKDFGPLLGAEALYPLEVR